MPEEIYYLDRGTRDKLKKLWEDYSTRMRGRLGHESSHVPQAPEVYIARAPSGGIDGMEHVGTGTGTGIGTGIAADDGPPSAECPIYQLIEPPGGTPSLKSMSPTRVRVYNISDRFIDPGQWFLAVRDKFGRWIASIGDPPAEDWRWVYVTSNASSGGLWPARLLEKDNNGNRSLGAEVRVKLLPFAGSCFVVGDFQVTRNGIAGEYELYDGKGCDGWVHSVCRNNTAVCDKLYIPHPIRLVRDVDCTTGTGSGTA